MEQKLNSTPELQKISTISSLVAQTEKPQHYAYLKEFRVEQCQLFKEHKCTQHRPYTCFNWHFPNQRRRRPVRRKDGTFNYSPDIYCTKYDENSGLCVEGEDCPFLHRVAGDVERKYHLRYYKTCLCVHPTDSKGNCSKNGPHCAFAHGPEDLRPPVFDIRDLQVHGDLTGDPVIDCARTNYVVEDPVWEDQSYVLANYKTEQCKKPPRLCRQGYACPYYHNSKDKRRTPRQYKYRSTPCPCVKHAEEWGDPEVCESGEQCSYCHTRTEQQFHPEIYKSTKCNDMVQHGYCPRGPFCAFAHNEAEMKQDREGLKCGSYLNSLGGDMKSSSNERLSRLCGVGAESGGVGAGFTDAREFGTDISNNFNGGGAGISIIRGGDHAAFLSSSAPGVSLAAAAAMAKNNRKYSNDGGGNLSSSPVIIRNPMDNGSMMAQAGGSNIGSPSYSSVLLKQRNQSGTKMSWNSLPDASSMLFGSSRPMLSCSVPKAIGSEREMAHRHNSLDNAAGSPAPNEAAKIKASLYLQHEIGCSVSNKGGAGDDDSGLAGIRSHSFSIGQNFFLSRDTMENVNENPAAEFASAEEGFTLDGDDLNDRSRSGSLSCAYIPSSGNGIYGSSAPVMIPHNAIQNSQYLNSLASEEQGRSSADQGSLFRMSGSFNRSQFNDYMSAASRETQAAAVESEASEKTYALSPALSASDLQRGQSTDTQLRQELQAYKAAAEEWKRKCIEIDRERISALEKREEALQQVALLSSELKRLQPIVAAVSFPHVINSNNVVNSADMQHQLFDVRQLISHLTMLVERCNNKPEQTCRVCGRPNLDITSSSMGINVCSSCSADSI